MLTVLSKFYSILYDDFVLLCTKEKIAFKMNECRQKNESKQELLGKGHVTLNVRGFNFRFDILSVTSSE